jgi:hypothetical protein
MNLRQNRDTELLYRKRPEPCRIVVLSSLRMIDTPLRRFNDGPLVSHAGLMSSSDSSSDDWSPIACAPAHVEVSPSSWAGLRSRMLASGLVRAEVA